MMKLSESFLYERQGIYDPLTQKRAKNLRKVASIDHILLEGHNVTYNDFSILIPPNNEFKCDLKKSLLINIDKLKLNRKIYIYPLELFA